MCGRVSSVLIVVAVLIGVGVCAVTASAVRAGSSRRVFDTNAGVATSQARVPSAREQSAAPTMRNRVGTCRARVAARVLPTWARSGFTARKPRMPYLLGARGSIAAILWADPLLSPPPKDHNNKILWVSRLSTGTGTDLRIFARRVVGSTLIGPVIKRRVRGGPGPSIINLPTAGCYQVELRWSGHTDTLRLDYLGDR